ncbi:hypothetical protein Tco_1033925 [Tanacetum coccineum]
MPLGSFKLGAQSNRLNHSNSRIRINSAPRNVPPLRHISEKISLKPRHTERKDGMYPAQNLHIGLKEDGTPEYSLRRVDPSGEANKVAEFHAKTFNL